MRGSLCFVKVIFVGLSLALVVGCPLPYDFSGEGAGNVTTDPSTPRVTAPVSFSYSEDGGGSGSLPDGQAFYSNLTTTLVLETETENAVIYYTDDGSALTDFSAAKKFNASTGEITLVRNTSVVSVDLCAVAVGPGMLPSPMSQASAGVSAYPILTVATDTDSISEDGGSGTFIISSSRTFDSDIEVNLLTGGDYEVGDVTGLGASGTSFTETLVAGTTTITIPITGGPDPDEYENDTVTLTIEEGTDYSIGTPAANSIIVADNRTPILDITRDVGTISDNGEVVTFTLTSTLAPSSDLTVRLTTSGNYEAGDLLGLPAAGDPFTRVLPSGSITTAWTVTSQTDVDFEPESVSVSIVADPAYSVGSPSSASFAVTDTDPTLTLSANKSTMADNSSVTFTVNADKPPLTDLTVTLQATGTYETGDFTGVPASGQTFTLVLAQGATSAQRVATAQPDTGEWDNESLTVTLQSGTGYAVGSPAARSVSVSDSSPRPTLTLSANKTTMGDTAAVTFTVNASQAPELDTTVNLRTTGTYEAADFTGVPASGQTFSLTLAQGTTSVQRIATAQIDLGEWDDESLTVTIQSGTGYTVGSPAARSVSVSDSSPTPSLTLSVNWSSMYDGQSATFTVHATTAPEVNTTVNLSATGYDAGMISAPSSVTLPSGATSVNFSVTAPTTYAYEAQAPTIGIANGTGYTVGSPGSLTLNIIDNSFGRFEYVGFWNFDGGSLASPVGLGRSFTAQDESPVVTDMTGSAGYLRFDGVAGEEADVSLVAGGESLDKSKFTVAVRFRHPTGASQAILVGGFSYRWLRIHSRYVSGSNQLYVALNNGNDPFQTTLTISNNVWHTLYVQVDVPARKIWAYLDGGMGQNYALPSGFSWAVEDDNSDTYDETLHSKDWGNSMVFNGWWDWVFVANGILSPTEVDAMIVNDPRL